MAEDQPPDEPHEDVSGLETDSQQFRATRVPYAVILGERPLEAFLDRSTANPPGGSLAELSGSDARILVHAQIDGLGDGNTPIPYHIGFAVEGLHALLTVRWGSEWNDVTETENVTNSPYTLSIGENQFLMVTHLHFVDMARTVLGVSGTVVQDPDRRFDSHTHFMTVVMSSNGLRRAINFAIQRLHAESQGLYRIGLYDCVTFTRNALTAIARESGHQAPAFLPVVMGGTLGNLEALARGSSATATSMHVMLMAAHHVTALLNEM